MLAGTPAYMAPEQLADGALDARADLYSLGVVLFELLAGRLPHEADSLGELLRRVSRLPAPDLATLQPQVPSDLAQLVARVLDKDPARRPPDATALAAQLRAIAQALAPAPPPTPTPPAALFGSE
jgi:serine/threonine-protein kinase